MGPYISSPAIDRYIVSIVELDFHHDSIDGLIRIFQDHVRQIHVFTTARNIELLMEITYGTNVIFHPYQSVSKFLFLRRHRQILRESDFIFLNTIALNFGAYLAIPGPEKTILRVHNINKQFVPFRSVVYPYNLFTAWKFFSYLMREVVLKLFPLFRVLINRRIQHFTFPDDGLKQYVIEKGYLPAGKVFASVPFKVFSASPETVRFEDELMITVIGATDQTRRRYEEVVAALQEIYLKRPVKIRFVLLGKLKGPYGDWIFEQLKQITHPDFTLQYYSDNVPEGEFVEVMNRSHLIISPVIAATKTDIFREIYGQTKTSGSILDFIKFGIVTIAPDYYNPPAEMEVFFQKYATADDLAQKILYFYENPEVLNRLNRESKAYVAENYNIDRIYKHCIDALQPILNKK